MLLGDAVDSRYQDTPGREGVMCMRGLFTVSKALP